MHNKLLIILLGICFLLLTAAMALDYANTALEGAMLLHRIGSYGGLLIGSYLLISNGSTKNTWVFWVLMFQVGIFGIGMLFKIMHWPNANEFLLGAGGSIFITYLIAFILKKKKGRLDILKLLWVFTATVGALLVIFHIIPREYVYVRDVLFWIMVTDFVLTENKRIQVKNGES